MKKVYSKPSLVDRGKLGSVTAQQAPVPASGQPIT
jgi:hypothetical protein